MDLTSCNLATLQNFIREGWREEGKRGQWEGECWLALLTAIITSPTHQVMNVLGEKSLLFSHFPDPPEYSSPFYEMSHFRAATSHRRWLNSGLVQQLRLPTGKPKPTVSNLEISFAFTISLYSYCVSGRALKSSTSGVLPLFRKRSNNMYPQLE